MDTQTTMISNETRIKWLAFVLLVFMGGVGSLPYFTNLSVQHTMTELKATSAKESHYQRILALVVDAETGQRGFILTGKEEFLQPYHAAIGMIEPLRVTLLEESRHPRERETLANVKASIDAKLALLAQTIKLRREQGFDAAEKIVATGAGRTHMEILRNLIGGELSALSIHRTELRDQLTAGAQDAMYISAAVNAAELMLLGGALWVGLRSMRARANAESVAAENTEALRRAGAASELRNRQMATSADMLHALECVSTVEEASLIVSTFCKKLVPGVSGSLYLYRNSRDILERKATWGDLADDADHMEPGQCWAVRRGTVHFCADDGDLQCRHGGAGRHGAGPRVCMPLVTQDAVLGCLTLYAGPDERDIFERQRELLATLSEEISMSMSNIKLRETLRLQSIIDPLTELYNRRYMDETLRRELIRAKRADKPLAIIVIDLDHFKRTNDSHGHDGGDAVLKKVAHILLTNVRECDVVCRFGGEEMVILLPDCDPQLAAERAEIIRALIETLHVEHGGRTVRTTASFGVAGCPAQGDDATALFQAADRALYQAKHHGRNRVVTAGHIVALETPQA
jgi:diguanylate cyclase (GGDEF)-like protein